MNRERLDKDAINSILFFGYLPKKYDKSEFDQMFWNRCTQDADVINSYSMMEDKELVERGCFAWDSIFKHSDVTATGAMNVVPISGGLDSRAILAGLLKSGINKKKITTISFGVPGAYDYEIGKEIALHCGLKHISLNLDNVVISSKDLVRALKETNYSGWVFDLFYNMLIPKMFPGKTVIWSGFMGDPIAGNHLNCLNRPNYQQAIQYFCAKNKLGLTRLCSRDYLPYELLPEENMLDGKHLGFDDLLDFSIRQYSSIKNVVANDRDRYRMPFIDDSWASFMLNVPRKCRYQSKLYKKILLNYSPELFNLPISGHGMSLSASKYAIFMKRVCSKVNGMSYRFFSRNLFEEMVDLNYIDFNVATRTRPDFISLLTSNLENLKNRKIIDWIDISELLEEHLKGNCELGYELTLLVSIELLIKMNEENSK